MIELYTDHTIESMSKKIKRNVIIASVQLGVVLCACILLCVFANDDTEVAFQWIVTAMFAISACVFTFMFCEIIVPDINKKKYYIELDNGEEIMVCGYVEEVGQCITIFKDVHSYEITVKKSNNEGLQMVYWDSSFPLPDFGKDKIVFKTSGFKVVGYEVLK